MAETSYSTRIEKPLAVFRTLLDSESREIRSVLSFGVALGLLTLVVPVGVQALVNLVSLGSIGDPVVFLLLAVLAGLTLQGWLQAFQVRIIERMECRLFARMAMEAVWRIPRRAWTRGKATGSPETWSHLFLETIHVQKQARTLLVEGFALAVQAMIGLTLLAFYHPALLAYTILLCVAAAVVLFGLGSGAIESAVAQSSAKLDVAEWLAEVARKPGLFLSGTARERALQEADERVSTYLHRRGSYFRVHFRQLVGLLGIQAVASTVLLGLGGWLVVREQLSLGQLVAAELILSGILASMSKVHKQLLAFYGAVSSSYKLGGLLDFPLERATGAPLARTGPASLRLRGVELPRSEAEHSSRTEVDLMVEPGERVALLGSSGSGKSTLANLIEGLKEERPGSVLLDGHDLREIELGSLRSHVHVIREPQFLAGTIWDHVTAGRESWTYPEVFQAIERAGLGDVIRRLPDGLRARIDESGRPFSLSQLKRLEVARAFLLGPRLLVLDETLDDLDWERAARLFEAVASPDAPWTLLILTHDERIAGLCSRVVRLEQGQGEA